MKFFFYTLYKTIVLSFFINTLSANASPFESDRPVYDQSIGATRGATPPLLSEDGDWEGPPPGDGDDNPDPGGDLPVEDNLIFLFGLILTYGGSVFYRNLKKKRT